MPAAIQSEVALCNIALSEIGVESITSLTDTDSISVACNLWLHLTRDYLLAERFWSFAEKRAVLSADDLAATPAFEWEKAYNLPADYISIRKVNSYPASYVSSEWKIEGNLLMLKSENPEILYTFRNEEVASWPAAFTRAVSLKLAGELARTITGSTTKKREMEMYFTQAMGEAVVQDMRNQPYERGIEGAMADSRLVRARKVSRLG